jgi:alanyl-tRNA synthetase
LFVHYCEIKSGEFTSGLDAVLTVNEKRKNNIKAYHSATHLLHAALRNTLGLHVAQKGSYVGPDRLRFDFSHSKSLNKDEIVKINQIVNNIISLGGSVITKIMSPKKAIELGAMALFGEKYGEEVRVVTMGNNNNKVFSTELCGGTHVSDLSEIGDFQIINESSIASGVRRIEALRSNELLDYKNLLDKSNKDKEKNLLSQIKKLEDKIILLNGDIKQFSEFALLDRLAKLNNFFDILNKQNILKSPDKNIIEDHKINNLVIRFQYIHGLSSKDLRSIVDDAKKDFSNIVIIVFSEIEGKLSLAVGVSNNLLEKFDASSLIKKISLLVNGKGGGGRKDFAQAGGEIQPDIRSIYKLILNEIKNLIN